MPYFNLRLLRVVAQPRHLVLDINQKGHVVWEHFAAETEKNSSAHVCFFSQLSDNRLFSSFPFFYPSSNEEMYSLSMSE